MASPILYVELLTVGRRQRYFILRVVYALLLLLAAWFCYEMSFSGYRGSPLQDQAEFAYSYFLAFTWIQLLAVVLLTPAMLAGTLASEHERRTIDYLLTTPLNDWEIALGKFTARLGAVALQLAVGWPILAIFMTLGGVGPGQLFTSFGIALLTLMSTASLSLAISARAKKSREAITRTYLVLIALLTIPPMATAICAGFRHAIDYPLLAATAEFFFEPMFWLLSFNPFAFLIHSLVDGATGSPIEFGGFAAGHLTATALLLLTSVVGVRRFYLKSAGAATKGHDGPRPVASLPAPKDAVAATAAGNPTNANDAAIATNESSQRFGRSTARRAPWGYTLDDNPMLWKELVSERTALKLGLLGRIAAVLLYGFAVLWIGLSFFFSFEDRFVYSDISYRSPMQIFGISGVPMMSFLALLLITSRAAGSLTSEKEQDTWITLLSTPVGGREIVRSKVFGAIWSVRYWYYLIGVTWLLCAILYPPFVISVPFLILAHGLAALFCAAVGVRASLTSSTSLKAMGAALATVLFGASLMPLIAAGMLQTIYLTPFSLPTGVCLVHVFFMMTFSMFEYGTRQMDDEVVGLCVAGFVSFCGYLAITVGIYRSAVDRFDEFAGRVRIRFGPAGSTPPPPPPEMLVTLEAAD